MGSNVKKARVSWPSDSMLCQVKMFQREDCPAKVGTQRCSKSKASTDLPPGTEYSTRPNIPLITWKLPPQFILSDDLLVASGEESTETGNENLRIAKVLEAFYPHPSLISPTSHPIPPAVQVDDSNTPTIRLTPIEDDDDALALQSSQSSKAPPSLFGPGPDLSLSALLKTKELGSLVDADLLVKLLTDPIIIKNLTTAAVKPLETQNSSTTKPPPQHVTTSSASAMDRNGVPPVAQSIVSHVPTQTIMSLVTDAPSRNNPNNITRDDYFKNLIREHGGVANGTNNYKGRADYKNMKAVKVKAQKPCMFFGKGKGCKLGESCLYFHDPSKRLWTDAPRAKRLKFRT